MIIDATPLYRNSGESEEGDESAVRMDMLRDRIRVPVEIKMNSRITQICAGFAHSFALGVDGRLFAMGYGE